MVMVLVLISSIVSNNFKYIRSASQFTVDTAKLVHDFHFLDVYSSLRNSSLHGYFRYVTNLRDSRYLFMKMI